MLKRKEKKAVTNQVINIFILILMISVLSGMTFLFTSALKDNVATQTATGTATFTNLTTGGINNTLSYQIPTGTNLSAINFVITEAWLSNTTGEYVIVLPVANISVSSTGAVTNATGALGGNTTAINATITGSFNFIPEGSSQPYRAVNKTEGAGYQTTSYLPLLFLAMIFGVVLLVVLRMLLPYINLGNQMGGF